MAEVVFDRDRARILINKENVVFEDDVVVAVLHKSEIIVPEIPEEQIRECGETLASAFIVLARARRALEKGEEEVADKLISAASHLMMDSSRACSVDVFSAETPVIFASESPEAIKSAVLKIKEEVISSE